MVPKITEPSERRLPRTLEEVADILNGFHHVDEARVIRPEDDEHTIFAYVWIAISGVGVPPEVLAELGRANLDLTDVSVQSDVITEAHAEQVLRR